MPAVITISAPASKAPVWRSSCSPTIAPVALNESTDARAYAESTEPSDPAEPTENAEAKEPTDPIDSADPTDPIDRTEAREPTDRKDSSDHSESPSTHAAYRSMLSAAGPSSPRPLRSRDRDLKLSGLLAITSGRNDLALQSALAEYARSTPTHP
jgi:hypothetical protein